MQMGLTEFDQVIFDQSVEDIRPSVEKSGGTLVFLPGSRSLDIVFPSIAYKKNLQVRTDHVWIHGPQRPTFQSTYGHQEFPMDRGESASKSPIHLREDVNLDLELLCKLGRICLDGSTYLPVGPPEQ
jgi:hypothetical protein